MVCQVEARPAGASFPGEAGQEERKAQRSNFSEEDIHMGALVEYGFDEA